MAKSGGVILITLGLVLTSCSKEEPATQTPSAVAGLAKMGNLAVDPFAQMALAFDGNPSPDEIRTKLEPVLKMYGVELTNANMSLAGKTLTSLRKEQGHSEMSILDKMLQSPTNGEKFDDAARRVSTSMN